MSEAPSRATPPAPAVTGTRGGLSAFDHVGRGDAAPEWVRDGVVAAWGLTTDAEVSLIVLSENITFKVTVGHRPSLVVRLGRPGYAESVEHIRSELLWVEALKRDVGVSTPSPVRGVDGDLVQFIHDESGAVWTAVAFEFVKGTILEDRSGFAEHFPEIGTLAALLHEHARTWVRPIRFRRFRWDIRDLVGDEARWGCWTNVPLPERDRGVLSRAEERARAVLADARVVAGENACFGLIHGDLRPSNVMTDGERLTILDFDDCGFGYFLYDFGAALTFYEHRPEARAMAAGWLDGYREVTPLSRSEVNVACALSMVRRLTMLGWAATHRADALPADLWAENQPGTIEVAARYLADPLWLVR